MNQILATVFMLVVISSFGQDQIRFERITVNDGLSQSAVRSMIQDQYGYLWIGTLDGLNKYDGNKFYVYNHLNDNINSIPRNIIHKLFTDDFQNLWISTNGYLSRYDQEKNSFINFPAILNGRKNSDLLIHHIYQQSDSSLILSTTLGIWEFNTFSGTFNRNTDFAAFDSEEVLYYTVNADETKWVAIARKIFYRESNASEFTELFNDKSRIEFLHVKSTNEIYVQTANKLYKYDSIHKALRTIFQFDERNVDVRQMRMIKLSTGDLWVGRREVHVFDSADNHVRELNYVKQDPFALSSDYLSSLYETRDGVVWVGTNGMGINKYSPQLSVFSYFGSFPGAPLSLSNNFVTSIVTRDDNIIYVATTDGLDVLNRLENTTHHLDVKSINGIKCRIIKLALSPTGELWIATSRGLQKYDGKVLKHTGVARFDDTETLVNDLLFLSSNELLVANSLGIYLLNTDTNHVTELTTQGTLFMKFMNNVLWTEYYSHINVYDSSSNPYIKLQQFQHDPNEVNSLPNANVKCFFQDHEGTIWIGTSGGGLVLYDPGTSTFRNYTDKDGLPNNVVYGILEDKKNNLWLSTNKGISVFNKNTRRIIRNYNRNHGLQGDEFNTNAYFISSSGKMYFGGVNGLTVFEPSEALSIVSEIPKSIITGLFVNGAQKSQTGNNQSLGKILENNKMELAWDERNFGFEISSLGFSYPAYTSFQYMLSGFDNNWTSIENERRIQFTNIPPGTYTLKVKASNSFGEWEKDGIAVTILINPPIWQTRWFQVIVGGLVLLVIYLFFQWRTHGLRRQTTMLENLVSVRTRELQIRQDKITAQNEELTAQSELMDLRNTELEKVKASLEERVIERTTVLQRLNEELIDQNTKLEQFTFITAHNIRGPIARIKGLINLLPNGGREVIDLLDSSVRDLDNVITDLSQVLNIRKRVRNINEQVEIRSQLMFVLKTLSEDIKNVNAVVDISQFQEVNIGGLKPYIYSIFYNLIHNALKYSSNERRPVITCSTQIENGRVTIIVEDNGIGIDMRYARDKIFNLYQRFHTEVAGKGFGLFLTRTQIESMNGSILVESKLNEFTRFVIEFPVS